MVNKSGTIEVRVQDIDLDENDARKYPGLKPGPYVQLSVMDSGHGMSESVLARVFDPFFTTKDPGKEPEWDSPSCMASSRTMEGRCRR